MTVEEQTAADAAKEVEAQAAADALVSEEFAGFEAGFSGEEIVSTKTPEELQAEEDAKVAEKAAADEKTAAEAKAAEEAKTPEVKYAQLTDAQLKDVLAKTQSIDELRAIVLKVRDESAGRYGSLEQTIKKLQDSTPSGKAIEVTAADLAEFGKDIPDLGEKLAKDLTKILGKFRVTGESVMVETPEQLDARMALIVEALVEARVSKVTQNTAQQILESRHENWRDLIGPKDSETPFRLWLRTQPKAYEDKILDSWSGSELANSIDKFKKVEEARLAKEKEEKAKKPATPVRGQDTRSRRLEESIPARGGSVVPIKREKSVEDAFAEGFKS